MSRDSGKGEDQPPPSKSVRNSLGERTLFPAPAPAMDERLTQALRESWCLAFRRRSPGRQVSVTVDAKGLASCLAATTVAMVRLSQLYNRKYYYSDDDEGYGAEESNSTMQKLQQECAHRYGGLIYWRLYYVQHASGAGHEPEGWACPRVSGHASVPNFVAEAIGSIGSYQVQQAEENTTYVPTLSEEDIQSQGCPAVEPQPGRYGGMETLLREAGIACKRLPDSARRDSRGSAWWLLRGRGVGGAQGEAEGPFEVAATLPPANFTEADVLCFAVATRLGQESMVESVVTPPLAADYGTLLHVVPKHLGSLITEACFCHVCDQRLKNWF